VRAPGPDVRHAWLLDRLDADVRVLAARGRVGPTDNLPLGALIRKTSPSFNSIGKTRISAAFAASGFPLRGLAIDRVYLWPGVARRAPMQHTPRRYSVMSQRRPEAFTILVIDDDPQVLEVVTDLLSNSGYRALVASSGQDALAMMQAIRPDLILLDYHML